MAQAAPAAAPAAPAAAPAAQEPPQAAPAQTQQDAGGQYARSASQGSVAAPMPTTTDPGSLTRYRFAADLDQSVQLRVGSIMKDVLWLTTDRFDQHLAPRAMSLALSLQKTRSLPREHLAIGSVSCSLVIKRPG